MFLTRNNLIHIVWILLVYTEPLFGHIYYLSPSGDNNNPGTIEAPWRTLQTAAGKMSPGDTLLIRSGMYRQATQLSVSHSGSAGLPLLFQNYPEETPIFCKSESYNNSSDWTDQGSNIWKTKHNTATGYDVGCVWHDDLASEKKWQASDLQEQWDFYYNLDSKAVELYSVGNPTGYAVDIEIPIGAQWQHVIQISGASHLIFDGLTVKYSNTHGIQMAGGAHHITVRNCTISHCGGAWIWDQTRYGNGIEVWESGHDILIEDNTLSWIFDSGLTNQGEQGTQSNLTFRGNTITNTKCGFEFWGDEDLVVQHVLVEDNLITDTGENWANNMQNVWGAVRLVRSGSQTEDFIVRGNTILRCGSTTGGQTIPNEWEPFFNHPSVHAGDGPYEIADNIILESRAMGLIVTDGFYGQISNNVISISDWCGVYIIDCAGSSSFYNNTIVNNGDIETYPNVYIADESGIWRNNILYSDVSGLLSVTGGDLDYNCYYPTNGPGEHSIQSDPLFIDIDSDDFSLQSSSPCIDVGTDVGISYLGDAPDMGAFEYDPASGIPSSNNQIEKAFILFGNYPNPFNPSTSILYQIPVQTRIRIGIYNVNGQEIRVIMDESIPAGSHQAEWDGKNSSGKEVPSGIYIYRFKADNATFTRKMALVR
ncbi:right-handed parallel beta-helix repeat-containing protein [candidate division KSB1 bacterium]|nr:right-handed parallel beta-helix repeat-containing protein [candidate division KSB1 bacterium]